MGKTIAEVLFEEGFAIGMLRAKREGVVRLLHLKVAQVQAAIEELINETEDLNRLDKWFVMLLRAKNFSEIHIPLKRATRGKKRGKARR